MHMRSDKTAKLSSKHFSLERTTVNSRRLLDAGFIDSSRSAYNQGGLICQHSIWIRQERREKMVTHIFFTWKLWISWRFKSTCLVDTSLYGDQLEQRSVENENLRTLRILLTTTSTKFPIESVVTSFLAVGDSLAHLVDLLVRPVAQLDEEGPHRLQHLHEREHRGAQHKPESATYVTEQRYFCVGEVLVHVVVRHLLPRTVIWWKKTRQRDKIRKKKQISYDLAGGSENMRLEILFINIQEFSIGKTNRFRGLSRFHQSVLRAGTGFDKKPL